MHGVRACAGQLLAPHADCRSCRAFWNSVSFRELRLGCLDDHTRKIVLVLQRMHTEHGLQAQSSHAAAPRIRMMQGDGT